MMPAGTDKRLTKMWKNWEKDFINGSFESISIYPGIQDIKGYPMCRAVYMLWEDLKKDHNFSHLTDFMDFHKQDAKMKTDLGTADKEIMSHHTLKASQQNLED